MKNFVLLSALLMYCFPAYAYIPEIKALDIYPSSAKFTFSLSADSRELQAELPGAFNAEEIRILNPLDADDIKITAQPREEWIPSPLADMKSRLEEHERTIQQLNSRRSSLGQTQTLLKAAVPPSRTDAKDIIAYIQMAQDMKLKTENEIAEIEDLLRQENIKAKILRAELDERMPYGSDTVIRITGHMKADVPLELEAFTHSAQWSPRYTMDLDSKTGTIITRLYSRTHQRTGLDYDGTITFHTKHPEERVTVPSVDPFRVGIKPKPQPTPRNTNDYVKKKATGLRVPKAPAPQVNTTLADHTVQGSGSLTGDGRSSEFMLGDIELTGKTRLVLVPEQRSSAWIVVDMDGVNVPLIPGNASLRVDGNEAGTTAIPEYGLEQKTIAFGYAPQITAKKEPIVETKGTSWFSGIFTGGYTLKVTNSMNEDRTVTVRDRLPIPIDDKIKLEVKRIEPEPNEHDNENRLTWELNLRAGETKTILVDYTLSYPSGEELQYRK